MEDMVHCHGERAVLLERIFEGHKMPTGYRPDYTVRTMGFEENSAVVLYFFGYSKVHYDGGYKERWTQSWNFTRYHGWTDPDLRYKILGRWVTENEVDVLAAMSQIEDWQRSNDEALIREFVRVHGRLGGLHQRLRVVDDEITSTVVKTLEKHHGRPENEPPGQDYTRVVLEDGQVLTVTPDGRLIFGDAVKTVSLPDETIMVKTTRHYADELWRRQQKAKEKRGKWASTGRS